MAGRRRIPEIGQAQQRARDSLFTLLVVTVLLGALLNALVGLTVPADLPWWGLLALMALVALAVMGLAYLGVRWEDRRIGTAQREIELLLPYAEEGGRRRICPRYRTSYGFTRDAYDAWVALHKDGLAVGDRMRADEQGRRPTFADVILPEHMALVRHLLVVALARFSNPLSRRGRDVKLIQRPYPLQRVPFAEIDDSVRGNPFSQATAHAMAQKLWLPPGSVLETLSQGPLLLRMTWSADLGRWAQWLKRIGYVAGGELRIRWLGPNDEIEHRERRYTHMTTRLGPTGGIYDGANIHVIATQLAVEIDSWWNVRDDVARWHDWALSLAHYLESELDYWAWRGYYLERTLDDLDWKIGYMERQGPSLATRLEGMDGRLARMEQRLWPDRPAEEKGDGAWTSDQK